MATKVIEYDPKNLPKPEIVLGNTQELTKEILEQNRKILEMNSKIISFLSTVNILIPKED